MRTLYNGDHRDLSLRGQITFKDGESTWVEIGDIFNYSFNSQIGSDGLPLGSTESASFSLELDNTGRKYTPESFDGAEVHMLLGIRPNPRNYIRNSEFRFESLNWTNWGYPSVCEYVKEGERTWCHVRGTATGAVTGQGIRQNASDTRAELVDGRQYTFSVLARGAAAGQRLTVLFQWRNGVNVLISETSRSWTVGTTARVVSTSVSMPADADRVDICVGVDSDTTAYEIYFSDLMLEPGLEVHDWMPAPEDFGATVTDGYAWNDFGVWYVDNASAPEQSVSIQLSGYDALATHFTAKFEDSASQYPLPLKDLFLTIATAANLRPANTTFANQDFPLMKVPAWDENTTLRDVLSDIAIAAGGFARIRRDGMLEIVSFSRGKTYDVDPGMYHTFTLTGGTHYEFNAIEALMDGDTEDYTRFALDESIPAKATNTIQLDYNPLISESLVNSIVTELEGIRMDAGNISWGGDPWVNCGDYFAVTTLNGESYRVMVTSQAFNFDGGLSGTETCSLPSENSVSSSSYSTSANAYDKNGNLRASRVAGLDDRVLAATRAHFERLTATTAEFDTVLAAYINALNLVAGRIDANVINSEQLSSYVANITHALISEATIDVAQIENLTATILDAFSASIGSADIGYAQIKDLIAQKSIITDGVGESLLIERLFVTSANLLGATIGKLVLQGEDGRYYEVVISTDGEISTREVTVSEGEILAGETNDGRQIVATDANIRDLNAQNIRAQSAIITEIFTSALTAGKINAAEAMLASATIPMLYATTIKAIGDSLDLSANKSVSIVVGNAMGNITDRVGAAESRLDVQEGEIKSRVTQSAFDSLSGKVSQNTSSIQQTASQIASKVSYGDLQSSIIQNAGAIRLMADKISWESTNSSMGEDGMLKCKNAIINGELESLNTPYWIAIRQALLEGGRIINGEEIVYGQINFTLNGYSGEKGMVIKGDCIHINTNTLYVSTPGQTLSIGKTGQIQVMTSSGSTTLQFINGILVSGI